MGTAVMIAAGANDAGIHDAANCKRNRPRPVVNWWMPELKKKPAADMAIVMLPAENKVA